MYFSFGFLFSAVMLASIQRQSARRFPSIRETSLTGAALWYFGSEFAWIAALTFSAMFPGTSAIHDQVWYWTAVVSVCPMIAVLGARRPTTRVWSLFIVLPMVAVLSWPALATLFHRGGPAPLRIQAPAFLGLGISLVMGVGNYLGTRLGLAVFLRGLAVVLAVVPYSASLSMSDGGTLLLRMVAGLLAATSTWTALRSRAPIPGDGLGRYDRLWNDFRDSFGIVWSMRIQESMNAFAEQRRLKWRIENESICWGTDDPLASAPELIASLDQSLRWHLRRFVDPPWIDRRLSEGAAE